MSHSRGAFIWLFVLMASAAVATPPKSDTAPFVSKEGRFAIEFPAKPETSAATVKTVGGDVEVHRFAVTGKKNEISYLVQYNDIPADLLRDDGPDKILDLCRDSGVAGIHGKIASPEVKSSLEGNPGRALEVAGSDFKVEYRIYLVKNRLYQLIVFWDGSKELADRAEPFLSSFKLLKE